MALCSMCFQQRNTAPLYIGERHIKVAQDVCRGCTMGIEKALNYISFRGYIIDLIRSPHLWSDAVDDELRGEGSGPDPEPSPDGLSPGMKAIIESPTAPSEAEGDAKGTSRGKKP